jgi:hypothetical protein
MPISHDDRAPVPADGTKPARRPQSLLSMVLNGCIVVTFAAIAYFSYTYIARSASTPGDVHPHPAAAAKVIQLDVLNGCGARGAASHFTGFLRTAGFDVVEMKNYKVRTIEKTIVIDRVGNLAAARRVAAALGVSESNIVQQINPDYFVDVSVIIGADYTFLQPLRH